MLDRHDPETGEIEIEMEGDGAGGDAPDFDPELGTLMGDLRDAMLMRIRTLQRPWAQMSEQEQMDCANGIELAAKDMVRKSVRLLNKHEWPHCVVNLGEVKIKGEKGIEAKIETSNIAHNRNVLGEHVGQHVMIMMVDSDTFMAARAEVQIDRDQPEMDLDGKAEADPGQTPNPEDLD